MLTPTITKKSKNKWTIPWVTPHVCLSRIFPYQIKNFSLPIDRVKGAVILRKGKKQDHSITIHQIWMQNQTLIFLDFFVFCYGVVFLKQTPNQLKFFWYLFSFLRYCDSKFLPLVVLEHKAILDFLSYSLLIFLTKMSIYILLGARNSKMQSDLMKYKHKNNFGLKSCCKFRTFASLHDSTFLIPICWNV